MNNELALFKKKSDIIKNSTLLLIAFATVFFPRLLETLGFPSLINFVHFVIVPFASGLVLFQAKTKNRNQFSISMSLLVGLAILFGVTIVSTQVNNAGIINLFLEYLLLTEPYMFLLAVICIPMDKRSFTQFRNWIVWFSCFHIFLALVQKLLLQVGIMRPSTLSIPWDNIQGVFYLSGSGHVVGASVSISFGLYYLVTAKNSPLWLRASVFMAAFLQLLFADAKQVLLVSMISWGILIFINVKDIKLTIQYLVAAIVISWILIWCVQNLEIFRAFKTWIKPELYGPDGEATILKSTGIKMIYSYYKSPLNWLFGLGPGHTIGRLGGWMLDKYWDLLKPLGATIHPVTQKIWDVVWGSLLARSSSMFSPLFGWAGIWGDLGFLGLGAYLYIFSIVWHRLCLDNLSKFLMLNVFIHGLIFSQMEEPGYMLFVTGLIGLQWQERRIAKAFKDRPYMGADINRSFKLG